MDETPLSNPFDEADADVHKNTVDDEYSSRRPLIWALLGVILFGCGVFFIAAFLYFQPSTQTLYAQYFPSPTSTPSRMPTRTPTPDLTATAIAMQASGTALAYEATAENVRNNGKVILSDPFDSNRNNWLLKPDDDEYALKTYEISNGKYRWDVTAYKPFIGWVRASLGSQTDFYVSVDIQQIEGPDTADYGLIFREDAVGNFYYFGVGNHGHYTVLLYSEEWETLIDWTETDLIQPGEVNRLTVLGDNSHYTFFINSKYVAEITDDTLSFGYTALAVELSSRGDHAIFEFDNFDLRAP